MKLILISGCLLTWSGCQYGKVNLNSDILPAKHDLTQRSRPNQDKEFIVLHDTKLLSRGVKVTSSALPVFGELGMITDGKKDDAPPYTRKDDFLHVQLLETGLQWVQLDLGKPHVLHAIMVWHYFGWCDAGEYSIKKRVYEDIVVQVSNDPEFKKNVKTVFNNDHDNSSGLGKGEDETYLETGEGRRINPEGAKGRYVRLYSCGYKELSRGDAISMQSQVNDYIEVEVYGN